MGSEGSMSDGELLKSIAQLRETYKGNLTLTNFDLAYYHALPTAEQKDLLRCVNAAAAAAEEAPPVDPYRRAAALQRPRSQLCQLSAFSALLWRRIAAALNPD
jgi:hypothetical protein